MVADTAVAGVVMAQGLAQLASVSVSGTSLRPADPWGYLLVVALSAPLSLRRRVPRTTLALVLAATALLSTAGYSQAPVGIPFVVALYTVGAHCTVREAAAVLVLTPIVVLGLSLATSPVPVSAADVVQVTLFGVGGWWLGTSIRSRREDAARQAVTQERLRIARELHDVVAHSMSVVAVQSGVAAHVVDAQPEQAKAALETIAASSRTALEELRRLLDVLRPDGEAAGGLAPAPGLADLDRLVERVEAAGVRVTLVRADPLSDLPAGIDLTVYRIVQEALTNTIKHAGPGTAATVRVARTADQLELEIVDDGRGTAVPQRPSASAGLVGMRERVGVFGGSLDAGPVPGGGWRVAAILPVQGPST